MLKNDFFSHRKLQIAVFLFAPFCNHWKVVSPSMKIVQDHTDQSSLKLVIDLMEK